MNHHYIQNQIYRAIYDLPKQTEELDETSRGNYAKLERKAIRLSIMNDGEQIPRKFIWIVFPQEITQGQIQQLRAYQEKFGTQVSKASKTSGKKIVGFMNMLDGGTEKCEDFSKAIEYAEKLPLSKEKNIEDKFIIGDSISIGIDYNEEEDWDR